MIDWFKSRAGFVVPLFGSWFIGFLAVRAATSGVLPGSRQFQPSLPTVAAPPGEGFTDVVSVVPLFLRGLLVAIACALLIEISKFVAVQFASGRSVFWLLVVYQFVLVADLLRALAPDWFTYFLSFVGVIKLDAKSYDFARLEVPRAAPWPSFVLMVVLMGVAYWRDAGVVRLSRTVRD